MAPSSINRCPPTPSDINRLHSHCCPVTAEAAGSSPVVPAILFTGDVRGRLGDGIDGNIAEYWELLFDLDTGCWKEEIRDEYEASGCDLLIIDCIEISSKFRGTGVGPIAIDRTIDIFGPFCGLVACKPWPLQFTPSFARDRKALKRLNHPALDKTMG
jgi:hypothetical protein